MEAAIELVLDDGVLVARDFSVVADSQPTEREYYGIDLPEGRLLYARQRPLVIEQAGLDPDDLTWVDYDETGSPVAGTDCEARLDGWLDTVIADERLESWGDGRNSEYGVA